MNNKKDSAKKQPKKLPRKQPGRTAKTKSKSKSYINEDAFKNMDAMFDKNGNVIPEKFVSLFNDENSTYEEDEKRRKEFEDYIMNYEYDEKDLFLEKPSKG